MKYNKILFISLALLVLLFVNTERVNAIHSADSFTISQIPLVGSDPGTTATMNISIDNHAGLSEIFTFISTPPILGTNKLTAPTITSKSIVSTSPTDSHTFSVTIPATPEGVYTADLTITKASDSSTINKTYTVKVNSKSQFSADKSTLTISSQPDKSSTGSFTITNTGSTDLTTTVAISGTFNDTKGHSITFDITFDPLSTLTITPGASSTVSVKAKVPNDQKLGTYTGKITLTTTQGPLSKILDLNVIVEPDICSDGRRSNDAVISSASEGVIRVDVDDPDDGDDLSPGEEIQVKANIENTGGDDLDISVEASLVNLDKNDQIVSEELSSTEVKEDDDKDFRLTLKVPVDEDIKESDDYAVIVKAFEDGDEDKNCNFDSVNVDVKRKSKDAIINNFVIEPSKSICNSNVRFTVDVENIGKKEDNIQVKVLNSETGLDIPSDIFELTQFDESGNIARRSFSYLIPSTIKSGIYSIESIVFFDSGKKSKSLFKNLDVTCTGAEAQLNQGALTLLESSFSAAQGRQISVPVKIKNPTASSVTYTVEFVSTGWADTLSQQETVTAGQEITTFLYPTIKTSASFGTYTGTINLKSGTNVLGTSTVSVNVQQSALTGTGTTGGAVFQPTTGFDSFSRNWIENGRVFWVLGIIVLVLLIILFIRLIFRK